MSAPPREPSLGAWALTLSLGLPLYALLVLAVAGYFLPWLDSHLFDTRVLFANNFDKIDELVIAEGPVLEDLVAMLRGWLADGTRGVEYYEFNVLPLAVVARLLETAHPIRAYNLLLAGCWILAGLCTAGLTFRLSRSREGALWAGALFAFGPMVTNTMRIDSLDYAMLFQLPLLLWALVSVRERRSWLWPAIGGLTLAAMGITNQYFWLAATPTVAAWGLLCWLRPLNAEAWPQAPGRAGASLRVGVILGLGLALVAPLIAYELTEFWSPDEVSINKAIGTEVSAPVFLARHGIVSPWTLLALILGAAAFLPRRDGGPRHGLGFLATLAVLLLGGFGALTLLAEQAGPLLARLPLLWRLQRLADCSVLAVLALSALAGVGLAGLQARMKGRWQRLVLLGVAWGGLGLCMLWDRNTTAAAMAATAIPLSVPAPVVAQVRAAPPQAELVVLHASPSDLPSDLLSRYLRLWTGRQIASTRAREDLLERATGSRRPMQRQGRMSFSLPEEACTMLMLVEDPADPRRARDFREALGSTEHATLHDGNGWYVAGLGRCRWGDGTAPDPQAAAAGVPEVGVVMRSMPMRAAPEAELRAMLDELSRAVAQHGQARQLFSRNVGTDAFIASLEIQPGEALADIGCGTGAVELALLELGVPFSRLWAADTVQANLDMLPRVLAATGQDPGDRIVPVLAANDRSGLEPGTVDRVLIVNVSSFEARRSRQGSEGGYVLDPDGQSSLATIRRAMRPGARLLFYADRLPPEFEPAHAQADPAHPWPATDASSYARFPFGPGQHDPDFRLLEYPLEAAGFTITARDILVFEGETGWMRVIAEVEG